MLKLVLRNLNKFPLENLTISVLITITCCPDWHLLENILKNVRLVKMESQEKTVFNEVGLFFYYFGNALDFLYLALSDLSQLSFEFRQINFETNLCLCLLQFIFINVYNIHFSLFSILV